MTTQSNVTEPLVIERTFNATTDKVWLALTDADAMRQWYFDLNEFKLQVGFEFQFVVDHEGHTYDHRCRVTEVIPLKKLAYSWRYAGYEGDSLVTFELFAEEGDRTRVKLTHEGLENFPHLPSFARENFLRGWTQIVGADLKEYVEQAASFKLVVTREFNAPLDLVWQTWTEAARVEQWLRGGDEEMTLESISMDLRVGGKFRIQHKMANGEFYTAAGTYLEVKPGVRLVHTWDWEKDGGGTEFGELEGNETLVTVEFEAQGKQTQVALTHEKFATIKSRDGHETGWTKWLEQAAKFIGD